MWGNLICHYILAKLLQVLSMVLTPHMTITFNDHLVDETDDLQMHVCSVYNGHNHYNSSHKYLNLNISANIGINILQNILTAITYRR